MKQEKTYREGNINFAGFIDRLLDDAMPGFKTKEQIQHMLQQEYPQIANKARCPHCDASMEEYVYRFDVLCALLLLAMANAFRVRISKGLTFTEANQIRVPELDTTLAIKCRTTISAKLGLVAKVKNKSGRQARGVWAITDRGWAALRGEEVPSQVKVFRGEIKERYEERITLSRAFQVHREAVELAIAENRKPKRDYRWDMSTYRKEDWYEVAGNNQGNLL